MEDGEAGMAGLTDVLARHRPQLLRFFTSRTGDAAEAEDIIQEIWLHIARGGTGPVERPLAWLHRVGMNIHLDRLRERTRRTRREADWTDLATDRRGPEAADDAPSPAAVADSRQRLQQLLAAIDTLPPGTARIFRRHKIDGLSHAQVATEFGISRSAVEKHMAVALAHLRARLDP